LNLLHFASSREAHELGGGVCKSMLMLFRAYGLML
jgi:hypothetical protein